MGFTTSEKKYEMVFIVSLHGTIAIVASTIAANVTRFIATHMLSIFYKRNRTFKKMNSQERRSMYVNIFLAKIF